MPTVLRGQDWPRQWFGAQAPEATQTQAHSCELAEMRTLPQVLGTQPWARSHAHAAVNERDSPAPPVPPPQGDTANKARGTSRQEKNCASWRGSTFYFYLFFLFWTMDIFKCAQRRKKEWHKKTPMFPPSTNMANPVHLHLPTCPFLLNCLQANPTD